MNRVLLVMPYEQYVRQAQQAGFWVCSLWDPKLATPDYLRQVEAASDAFLLTDFDDDEQFRRVLRDTALRYDVGSIHHIGREDSMLAAAEVADELDVAPNPAEAVRRLNDKQAMRELLAATGLSPVRHRPARDVAEVRAVVDDFGLPAVVKPTSLSGSRGVYLLRTAADLDRWVELVRSYDYTGPFLLEEQLVGPEFSVESLSRDGQHQMVGVTAKEVGPPPLFVERGHVHPAPLADADREGIETLVTRLLDACGYRSGPAHTEVIVTSSGPRIVESQARLGGDRIHRLVELSTGLDLEAAVYELLAGAELPEITHRRTARIRYLDLPPGVIGSVDGLDRAAAAPGVDELDFPYRVGDPLPATTDSKTRHGHVIVVGDTPAQTETRLAAALGSLLIRTLPHRPDTPTPEPVLTGGTPTMKLIDISQGWYVGMPSFDAAWYPRFGLDRAMTPDTDPTGRDRTFSQLHLFPHNGSHVESGRHFFRGGTPIDDVPLGVFVGRAVVANLSAKRDLDQVCADDLERAVGDVWRPGDRLLVRTDHPRRHLGDPDYWERAPYLTPDAADWMVQQGASLVGMDCVTEKQGERAFPVHRRLLGADIPLLENITNLHEISEPVVWLVALPIKVSDVEAAPVRAVVLEGGAW